MLVILNKFARLASARSEVVGASLILLMVVMMIIPLPPAMLDVLIALNISASIVLVISAVLLESPLAFSSFPALLLMTTLFRLSLTISTTRQILLEADAGHIVQTFGEFVVGGNVAVGLTIFIIISVVNFLVVTKGSERVAEVAARFSLDGMPGKQMSIDSDLRANLITQTVAKQRRSDLEKESQLFGAMDGAIKFVKNDAIAGLVITIVNLLGGLTVGMLQKGLSFGDAGHMYTILSVGDGLVGIIPSLLISIAAGLIVTRVTKGEADGSNTAQDMMKDLSRNSNALQISGIFCFFFAFVPGMPTSVFILASAGLFFAWFTMSKKTDKAADVDVSTQFNDMLASEKHLKMEDVLHTETFAALEVRLPIDIEPTSANQIQNICRIARNRKVDHLGILLPLFEFNKHPESFIEFYVYGVPCLSVPLSEKRLSVRCEESVISAIAGVEYAIEKDSVTGKYEILCDPVHKPVLDQNKIDYLTFETRLVAQIEALLVQKVNELFTLNEYQRHMTALGDKYAEQMKELDRVLPITKVVDVLQRLLGESVSIKNMRSILNSLIEWGQRERDPMVISEQVRRGLFEQICHQHTFERKLRVFTLGVEFEQLIRESSRSDGSTSFIDIDASSLNELVAIVEKQCKPYLFGNHIPAIVCSMDCRVYFRQIIQDALFIVPVLSHQEVSSNMEIQVLGNITLDAHTNNNQHADGLTS
jgi:type III secretion protein V